MKLFSGFFGFLLLLAALAFALNNRQGASIILWPFGLAIDAPLYLLILGAMGLGLLLGGAITWFSLLPQRLETRRMHKDINNLRDKLEELQQTVTPRETEMPQRKPGLFRRWRS